MQSSENHLRPNHLRTTTDDYSFIFYHKKPVKIDTKEKQTGREVWIELWQHVMIHATVWRTRTTHLQCAQNQLGIINSVTSSIPHHYWNMAFCISVTDNLTTHDIYKCLSVAFSYFPQCLILMSGWQKGITSVTKPTAETPKGSALELALTWSNSIKISQLNKTTRKSNLT